MIPDVFAPYITVQYSTVYYSMGPLQVWLMVKSTRRYIGTAITGALYSLSYLLFVVCM